MVYDNIIGGACTAWMWRGKSHTGLDSREDLEMSERSKRSLFDADLFGSICYTLQHGKFRNDFGDLTRVDARLDICSASGFARKVLNGLRRSSADGSEHPSMSPRLNITFQQQVSPYIEFLFQPRTSYSCKTFYRSEDRNGRDTIVTSRFIFFQ